MKPLTVEEIAELRKIVRIGYSHTLEERVLHVDAEVRRKCEMAVLKAAPRLLDEIEASRETEDKLAEALEPIERRLADIEESLGAIRRELR